MNIISNKGMFLETLIINSCEVLKEQKLGHISKVSVNHDVIKVENNVLTGLLKKNDNCDFIGIYRGSYFEFDAKETEKEWFPMANVKKHQLEKLKTIAELGGIAFLFIYFHQFNRFFIININQLKQGDKKIPLSWLEENGIEVFLDNVLLNLPKAFNKLWVS